jgi:opacity protein-like surface antigen
VWARRTVALLAGAIVLLSPVQASAVPANRAAALEAWLKMDETALMASGWTGSVDGCVVGTESAESIAATLNAVNTLRDFAGVGPVTFDPALTAGRWPQP